METVALIVGALVVWWLLGTAVGKAADRKPKRKGKHQ